VSALVDPLVVSRATRRRHDAVNGAAPTSRVLVSLVALAVIVLSSSNARALTPDEVGERIRAGHDALDRWQLDEAVVIASELERALPDVPPVQALLGLVKFHQGDFEGALSLLERANEAGVDPGLLALVRSTAEETRGSVAKESAHFVVRTPPGKDEILADIALEKLEIAYAAVSKAFDYAPGHKIAVDILHDAGGLARVSTLTETEIRTSGTIALCKYNRLMITSPKALARGYSWIDTLAHELIHLVISEKSKNSVPIWLHEGLAKYSESLWRGAPGLALEPASENILARAVKSGKLITFEQMHPSMAKLPSQEDTALAFAEVFTVIEFMHAHAPSRGKAKGAPGGFTTTNKLLDALAAGMTMDAALKSALGMDLAGMQRTWRASLQKRKFKLTPGAAPKTLTFVKNARTGGQSVDEEEDEGALAEAGKTSESRRFVRLGSMLRRRGHTRAASLEYQRARATLEVPSVALDNRLALLHIELDELDAAKRVLAETARAFPDDPQTRVLLGRVAMKEKRYDDAHTEYEHATWENPMNPEIWAAYHQIGEAFGDQKLKSRAEQALVLLTRHARSHGRTREARADRDETGTLSVRSTPWGEVLLDGRPSGMVTPVVDLRVPAGRHIVRVRDVVSGTHAREIVVVESGQAVRLDLKLTRVPTETLALWIEEEQKIEEAQKSESDLKPAVDENAKGRGNEKAPSAAPLLESAQDP
jgi:tetratricopeptide (TPR) repeat protein